MVWCREPAPTLGRALATGTKSRTLGSNSSFSKALDLVPVMNARLGPPLAAPFGPPFLSAALRRLAGLLPLARASGPPAAEGAGTGGGGAAAAAAAATDVAAAGATAVAAAFASATAAATAGAGADAGADEDFATLAAPLLLALAVTAGTSVVETAAAAAAAISAGVLRAFNGFPSSFARAL